MPRLAYKRCRKCKRSSGEVGELSWTRQCAYCGDSALVENVASMVAHRGPGFEKWRRSMAASVGAVLLDDVEAALQTRD